MHKRRGHTRANVCGLDLNRCYSDANPTEHEGRELWDREGIWACESNDDPNGLTRKDLSVGYGESVFDFVAV